MNYLYSEHRIEMNMIKPKMSRVRIRNSTRKTLGEYKIWV